MTDVRTPVIQARADAATPEHWVGAAKLLAKHMGYDWTLAESRYMAAGFYEQALCDRDASGTAEQWARDLMEQCGWDKAQDCSSGEVIYLANVLSDHRSLLARVAALEAERDDWKQGVADDAVEIRDLTARLVAAAQRAERVAKALVECAIPLEVLRSQIAVKPYAEMTVEFMDDIVRATNAARAALAPDGAAPPRGDGKEGV